jgi:outer membrane protein assembly factor BamB
MRSGLFLVALLLVCASLDTWAGDWPEFMGPTRDQISNETELLEVLPKDGPRLLWEKPVGKGYSAPSIRGDLLVVFHRLGKEEIVEALDVRTGEARWRFAYPTRYIDPFGYNDGPRCTPLLTTDRCYTFGAEGLLLCLDLANGKVIWHRETQKDFEVPEAFFGVGSSPILEEGMLIVQVGAQPNSCVVAFDAATGKTIWENGGEKSWTGVPMTGWPGERTVTWNRADPTYEKQASYCTPVAATIHGKRHILVVSRQGLISFEPKTGAVNFSFWFRSRQNETVNAMTPVVSGDLVFLSTAYYRFGSVLLRVKPDGKSVEEVWRGTQLEIHWTTPVLHDGHLFAFTGRNEPDAHFRCVELATGKVKWDRTEAWPNGVHGRVRRGDEPNVFGRGSAILAEGKLIALGEAGLLGLFQANAEKIEEISRWQVPQLAYPCWAAPVLANRVLYLRDEDHLLCFDFAKPSAP